MQHHHRGQTAGFLSRCISQLQQRMSYSSDIPGGTHQLTNMLDRTNQRQFIMANTVALVFMLYTFINQLFFNSGWESWQTRAFLLLDAGFGLLILVSIVLVVLEQPLGIPARLMRAYRLGYLSFVLSWAACVSVFEAVTVRGVYTYMVVALIVSLVFFHKLWELAIVFTAGQSVFILLLSSGIVPVPNAAHLADISWGIVVICLFVSRIPYYARRQGLAYELSMRKAYADREQANRAKTDFLRNISHELRTPLTGILGFSEAIVHQTGEKSTEKYARLIQNEGEKLLTLINRLLDISKIEAGKFELHPLAFDLKASLSGFAESFRERARLKGLDFRFETDGRIPDYVMGDEAQLLQVLANLTGNAVKFTKKGFVSLSAVVERLTDAGVAVRFEVSDTGIGISRDKQGEIFSAFSQEDPSISREYGGTGLGTTLSRKIVELMGGVIELESEKGRGSRFSFSLDFPLPREDRDQVPAAPVSDAAGMKGKRILVVEDYPVNQKIARMHLEGLGCEVYLAENGLECLRMLREGPYDAVLLDIQMPVMDGLETVRIIRGTEDLAKILVVAITANAFEEDQQKYREAGMDGIILKPFRRREIQETLSGLFTSQAAGVSSPI